MIEELSKRSQVISHAASILRAAEVSFGKCGVEGDCGDPPRPRDVGDGKADGGGDLDTLEGLVIGIVDAMLEHPKYRWDGGCTFGQ